MLSIQPELGNGCSQVCYFQVQDIMASAPDIVTDSTWGDLGSMKVHKSRLEKVKETYKSLVKQPARYATVCASSLARLASFDSFHNKKLSSTEN